MKMYFIKACSYHGSNVRTSINPPQKKTLEKQLPNFPPFASDGCDCDYDSKWRCLCWSDPSPPGISGVEIPFPHDSGPITTSITHSPFSHPKKKYMEPKERFHMVIGIKRDLFDSTKKHQNTSLKEKGVTWHTYGNEKNNQKRVCRGSLNAWMPNSPQ